jgi:ATP-dependent exoDNAse (exonuclease V) beta subunit
MNPMLALDAQARAQALDVRHSILLQAPAGSGKTTVLTARFLALLATVDLPEQILAITFTRKAAAEMRHRLLGALQAARSGSSIPGIAAELLQAARLRDEQRGWDLLRNPARLRIETIDALNHWLASQLPIASRSGARLQIASHAAPLYQRAARQCLQLAPEEPELAAAAELLFERLDYSWGRLERLLEAMLERRAHWLPRVIDARDGALAQRVEQSLQAVLRARLAAVLALLPVPLVREGAALVAHARRARGVAAGSCDAAHFDARPESLPLWQELCDLALTERGWRQRWTVREGFEREDTAMKVRVAAWVRALALEHGALEALQSLRALPQAQLSEPDRGALAALSCVLLRAAAELQLVFAASGRVDYAYVAAAARQALTEQGEPSDLALRTGAALRHLLVDEFQDTSFEQYELLSALTAGWQRGDGRTLLVVGDPMQSIYQFREAEVGLFLRARDHGIGELALEALQLRRNFRSQAALLSWINSHFAALFPPQDDPRRAAIRYLPSIAAATAHTLESAVSLHRLTAGDLAGEAAHVLQVVRQAREQDPQASIAVLVASREHAAQLLRRLRDAGYAPRGIKLERLRERPVIRELCSLTRALLHGADRSAWLALLRGPCCGLRLADMEALLAHDTGDVFAALRAFMARGGSDGESEALAVRTRIMRLLAALAPAIESAERTMPLWQRVEYCWLRLAGSAVYRSQTELLDAERFIDALALHEDPQRLVGDAIEELTAGLYSESAPQPGAIDVMTIHAAKGLEWDVVILPGLGRRTASDRDPLLHWIELPRASEGTDLLLAPIRATEQEPRGSLAAFIKSLRRERLQLERIRLLYVACTRARHALHLLGALAADDAQAAPEAGSLLALLWPALGEQFAAAPASPAQQAAPLDAPPPLWRLSANWRAAPAPAMPRLEQLPLSAPAPGDAPEYSWVGLSARAVGTIVHAELQRLASIHPLPGVDQLSDSVARYDDWLAELGTEPGDRAEASMRILRALVCTLEDPRGRWLLSSTHPQARSEWRLTGWHEGRIVNVIVDRMLLDERGERWIVDFKTGTHAGGAVEEFIAREAQRYRPQLQRYAALAAQFGKEPVRVALYFPLLGVFNELQISGN